MMIKKGSALLLVMTLIALVSSLLIFMHKRSALLLETVYEREKQLQYSYAQQGLLVYGIHIAKQNWTTLDQLLNEQEITIDAISWPIIPGQTEQGSITYNLSKKGVLVKVALGMQQPLSCIMQLNKSAADPEWVLSDWKI